MKEEFFWRTGRNCVFKNLIHLIFVTKYRRNVLTENMLDRLRDLFLETCQQMEVELLEFGGEDDHVHLMVCCPPKIAIANLVSKLKGKSSYFIRQEFWPEIKNKLWGDRFWSPSYCVVSCGGAPLEIVKQYVQNQRRPLNDKQIKLSQNYTGKKRDKMKKWLAPSRRGRKASSSHRTVRTDPYTALHINFTHFPIPNQ